MKYSRILLLALLVVPWLTLPLLGKKTFKRFLPASLFISLVVSLESVIAKKRRWWWFYQRLHPKLSGEFPLIWGSFLIGSMWIMKFTYRKFYIYLFTNLIVDTIFTYPFVKFLKKTGTASLVRLKGFQLSILFFIKSLLLYAFQFCMDKVRGYKACE
ncbi:hypothetical protein ACE38V_22450 [Cytobacillus sp. Hz8]|uniref:hypothetical protein n=1 Tax=Cytobacillus sp. Hz8 TaxID=3347168 RepID=UPI0035E0C4E5